MGIARFSVNRPVAVTMRILALVLMGFVCLTRLPVDLLPNVSIPTVAIVTQWPNVSPEEVETQVTRPVEEAVSSTPGISNVQSSSVDGVSTVRVQFNWGTDIGQGAVDVLQLVERARQRFPTDPTLQTPIVFKYDPSQLPILIMGVKGISDPVKLYTLMSNEVTPVLESANGVASAVVTGGEQRAIIINVDPDRLKAHGLALSDVTKRLSQENLNLPAGIAKESNTEYTIRALGWFTSPAQIAKVPLSSTQGQITTVGDVASVEDSHTETRLYTRLNSKPAVGLIITKQSGANTIETAKSVMEKIAQIQKQYPELKIQVAYDQSEYIANSIDDLKMNAVLGGTLALMILLFFLRNVRSTLVVALSIPTSIISTFALMYLCGFTINTMSLGGLTLATGLIVDDAVVVLENIFRHIERDGKTPREAAITGGAEIMSAVLASTMTVMIVFIPLMLIKGQSGTMFTQFALVVIFSIAVSLLDAITVVPMLASLIIKGEAHREESGDGSHRSLLQRAFHRSGIWFDAMDNTYRSGLAWALDHRALVCGGALGITLLSFLLVPQIGFEMMPQTDNGSFDVNVKMPPGTSLAQTDTVIRQVEKLVLSEPDVETAFSASGTGLNIRGATTALNSYLGAVEVKLRDNRKMSTQEVVKDLQKKTGHIAGARVFIQ
nr:efflux RND transporter permease subunit [Armatimonadota bacterium]